MPSEESVSLVFFRQIQCFVSGCQEVFAPEEVDPLDSKSKWLSSTSSFQGGTQLPLRAGVLLYGKLQTSHPIPCPQFRVPHTYPKSGRVTAEPSTGSSRWACLGNVFFLTPPQQHPGVVLLRSGADCPKHGLCTGKMPVNPAKGGSAILYMINKSYIRGVSTTYHKKPIR